MVSGLISRVTTAATAMLARAGIARSAAIKVCITGMITPTNSPSATPRGTERRCIRHSAGLPRCRAKGFSARLRCSESRVGMWCLMKSIRRRTAGSGIAPEEALLLAFPVALFHRLTLVMHFLTPSERQLDLRAPAAVEIDRQRDERQSLARHRALQLGDF